jgi:tetratricopeptide (TPR) repeat protein
MNKKSALISRIKNRIMSIISKLQNRNTEPDVTEEKEQTVDSEPISRSANKTETHSSDKKELIELKTELGESIATILNKLFDGISGVLEKEYKDRLIGLEKSIEELKKEKIEQVAPDLKEELEEVRNLAETAKSISEGNIEKIENITEESEIEKLEEKIEKMIDIKLSDISDDKLKGITTVLDYIKQAPEGDIGMIRSLEESEIEKLKDKIEKIEEMKLNDISDDKLKGITTVLDHIKQASDEDIKAIGVMGSNSISEEKLKRLRIIMGIYGRLPGEGNKESKQDKSTLLSDFLKMLQDRVNNINIRLLYNEGVMLLRKGDFCKADVCFTEITNLDPDIKGAWLNKGFALGKLGNIDEEIRCYEEALSKDKDRYEKAWHNLKIAKRKKGKSAQR